MKLNFINVTSNYVFSADANRYLYEINLIVGKINSIFNLFFFLSVVTDTKTDTK